VVLLAVPTVAALAVVHILHRMLEPVLLETDLHLEVDRLKLHSHHLQSHKLVQHILSSSSLLLQSLVQVVPLAVARQNLVALAGRIDLEDIVLGLVLGIDRREQTYSRSRDYATLLSVLSMWYLGSRDGSATLLVISSLA
jgi:hypothetical protein